MPGLRLASERQVLQVLQRQQQGPGEGRAWTTRAPILIICDLENTTLNWRFPGNKKAGKSCTNI